MAVSVRPMRKTDAKAVVFLFHEFIDYLRSLKIKPAAEFTEEAYRRDGFGTDPAFTGWVAVENKKVVGYLMGNYGYEPALSARTFHIINIYVTKSHRRKNIGLALMKIVAKKVTRQGVKYLFWSVYKGNTSAVRFYEAIKVRKLSRKFEFMVLDKTALQDLLNT